MRYYLKAGALVLIFLVLSLILNSAVVMAGLSNQRVYGIDNVNGYLRETDNGKVDVDAEIEGDDEITPNQVKLSDEYEFTSCSNINGKFNCIYDFTFTNSPAKSYGVDISLYEDSGAKVDHKTTSFIIDDKEPIGRFEITEQKGTNLTLQIDANDKACDDPSCSGKCSAIKNIDITVDSVVEETVLPETTNCDFSKEVSLDLDISGTEEKDICIDLYDRVGNENLGQDCEYVTIDGTVPYLTLVQVTDLAYKPIEYITPLQREVYVEATIVEDVALDIGSVGGDMSELNDIPGFKESYRDLKATSCNKRGADWICYFRINLQTNQGGSKEVRVWAYDSSNNFMNQSYTLNLQMDNSDPVATGIRSGIVDDSGKSWVRKEDNIIYADITETGAGLSNANVYMNLAALMGSGYGKVKASGCEPSWTCSWFPVSVKDASTGDVLPVSLTYPSQDDAGNLLQGISGNMHYDKTLPVITSVEIFAVGGQEYTAPYTYKTGDILFVVINITELGSGVKDAYADFSNLFPGGENTSADKCENIEDEKWSCEWTTEPITGGHRTTSIDFEVIDLIGNVGTNTTSIEILGVSEEEVSFWNLEGSVDCSPEDVDATLAAYAPDGLSLYCSFKLTSSGVEAIYVEPEECKGADETSDEYIDSSESTLYDHEITTPEKDELDMYAKIVIEQKEIPAEVTKLKVNCSIMVVSAYQNKVYPPETVEFQKEFGVITSDLDLSENVRNEIATLKKNLKGGLWPLIGTLNKVVIFSKKICQIARALYVVAVVFNFVSGPAGEALKDSVIFGPIGVAVNVANVGLTQVTEGFFNYARIYCNIVSCRLTLWDIGGTDWSKNIENALNAYSAGEGVGIVGDAQSIIKSTSKPENSIVFSIITLCVPGVVYNLEKYRQIDCMYIDCVENWVPAGTSIATCQRTRYTNRCQYVFGELFQLIPLAQLIEDVGGLFQALFSDPLALIGLGVGLVCWGNAVSFLPSSSIVLTSCNYVRLGGAFLELVTDLKTTFTKWDSSKDVCSEVLKEEEGEEGESEEEGEHTP